MIFSWDMIIGLLIGLFIGWLVELLLDMRYWQSRQKTAQARMIQLQSEVRTAMTERDQIESQLSTEKSRAESAEERNVEFKANLDELKHKKDQVETELSGMQGRLRAMSALEHANNSLRIKVNSAESRHQQLDQDLRNSSQQLDTLQVQIQNDSGIIVGLNQTIDQLQAEKTDANKLLVQTQEEVATLKRQLNNAQEDAQALQAQLENSEEDILHLRANLTKMTARVETIVTLEEAKNDLQGRLESAESELVNAHNRLVAAEMKTQQLADKLSDERLRTQVLQQKVTTLTMSMPQDGDSADLLSRFQSAQHELVALRTELAILQTQAATQKEVA